MNATVWPLVVLQLASICITNIGFGEFFALLHYLSVTDDGLQPKIDSVFMSIAAAAPKKHSLGTTNGLPQMVVAIQRTVGPAVVASLFAFLLASDVLGGNFAYVVLLGVVCVGLSVAAQLPRYTWKNSDSKKNLRGCVLYICGLRSSSNHRVLSESSV